MYISEWDLHGAAISYYQQLCAAREKYTPRDMAFLHAYIRMGLIGAATSYYQQLQPQGRNIHPGTWHSMYISEWDLHGAALRLPAACATREKYTPRDMAFLHVYIRMGSHGAATTSSLCRKEYTGHGIPPCIYQNGIYTAALRLLPAASAKEKYTPRTWHLLVYINEWDLMVPPNFITSSHATRRNTHQGHGIPPCIYQNGI
jgi:hypothetical protein